MTHTKKLRRNLIDVLTSPKTSAFLKLGIAVIGVVSALKELRDADKQGFKFYGDDDRTD